MLTLNPGDTVKIDSGARAGDIYEYLGQQTYTVPFNFTAGSSTPAQVKSGQNVEVPAGTDGATANTVYQYVGASPLSSPNLATENYANPALWHQITALQQDYSNPSLWRQVNVDSNPLQVEAMSSTPVERGHDLHPHGDLGSEHQRPGPGPVGGGGRRHRRGRVGGRVGRLHRERHLDRRAGVSGRRRQRAGAGVHATSVSFSATDSSSITANAAAASLAASLAGGTAVSVAIGISVALNQIDNDVEAYIANATTGVTTTSGGISLTSMEDATIDATSTAASLAASFSGGVSVGISGAGADATNDILGKDNAYASGSRLTSAAAITFTTQDNSDIDAIITAAAVGVGVGTGGIGASIGVAVAQNFIGYDSSGNYLPLQVEAYALNTSIQATGAYTLTATSQQTINAITTAGSVAVAGGVGGAGAFRLGRLHAKRDGRQCSGVPRRRRHGDGRGHPRRQRRLHRDGRRGSV